MSNSATQWIDSAAQGRKGWRLGAMIALFTLTTGLLAGCIEPTDENGKAFRDAASDSLQTGLTSIATGVISGVFAVVDVEEATGGTDAGQ